MPLSTRDPFDDNCAHLATFPDHILRDLARNDCAGHEYRKHAVEVLLVRKSPLVKHPDLLQFVQELEVELDGIEFEHPDPGYSQGTPLSASVTTKTMFGEPEPPVLGFISEDFDDSLELTPSAPLSEATVHIGNSLIQAYVPEENILRDPEEQIVPTHAPTPIPPKLPRTPRKKKDTPDAA